MPPVRAMLLWRPYVFKGGHHDPAECSPDRAVHTEDAPGLRDDAGVEQSSGVGLVVAASTSTQEYKLASRPITRMFISSKNAKKRAFFCRKTARRTSV